MARKFAGNFYSSSDWLKVRDAYLSSQNHICEECGKPAEMVHHIIHLSPQNFNDIKLRLGFENLQALCNNCHAQKHSAKSCKNGLKFNSDGDLIQEK